MRLGWGLSSAPDAAQQECCEPGFTLLCMGLFSRFFVQALPCTAEGTLCRVRDTRSLVPRAYGTNRSNSNASCSSARFWTGQPSPRAALLRVDRHESVRQRLHEAHEGILLCVRQAKASNSAPVHVGGRFRRRPARRTFTGIMRLAARQHVARVVEVHDRLQTREVSIMPVGLHERRIGPLVHIAQCRDLNSRLIVWRQLEPSRIHRGGLAEQMSLAEKTADAAIDE